MPDGRAAFFVVRGQIRGIFGRRLRHLAQKTAEWLSSFPFFARFLLQLPREFLNSDGLQSNPPVIAHALCGNSQARHEEVDIAANG
ncbi:hypothetical protein C5Y93_04205 [Blastopirellula marina]|uniref:Uncharacterized protein n=1 Tax=Blastopirellula marina TaxID=124 RepID=A0A2S8GS51_9BACT|nr:hypothetical protein C5Y93_04205 [Blastopirellula marina]